MLEATNAALSLQVTDSKMALAKKVEEICQLKEQKKEGLDRIREVIGNWGDLVNKAHLFDNYIKTEMLLSLPKVIAIPMSFRRKMEATLVEMWKLVSKSPAESSRPVLPSPKATPLKEKPLVELKTPLLQRPIKELVLKIAKIEIPIALALAKAKKESETPKTTSSEPSQWKMNTRKTKKEPTPELRKEKEEANSSEEETVDSSSKELESEEEAEPATPPPEKKKKMETWASDWKKPTFVFKTLVPQKRPMKTFKKGESS